MDRQDNPYLSFVQSMREEGAASNPTPFLIGEVLHHNPLLIQVGEIQLEREDVLINEFLLAGYERRLQLNVTTATGNTDSTSGGSGDDSFASHSHVVSTIGIKDGAYKTLDDFSKGDKLLMLMSQDQQEFVVVCKVR